jgi:predicted TIM-barrel fold metal-dependent hydrolase
MSSGMKGLSFSSTTSCKDGVQYIEIEKEINSLLAAMPYTPEVVRPFFWYIPDYIKQGITVEAAFNNLPYKGIKIHPRAHLWEFENKIHIENLCRLFDYAEQNCIPVLIHTGENGVDSPDIFEKFFREFNETKFILAHCRPLEITIKMLGKYDNVYCDSAFVPETSIQKIISYGFGQKFIFGTDFPITHYFKVNYPQSQEDRETTLRGQYEKDTVNVKIFDTVCKA